MTSVKSQLIKWRHMVHRIASATPRLSQRCIRSELSSLVTQSQKIIDRIEELFARAKTDYNRVWLSVITDDLDQVITDMKHY